MFQVTQQFFITLLIALKTLAVLLEDNPGTSTYWDENQLALAEGQ